ncbi:MAG: hypothetical protein EOO80_01295 [Oxalobacteraceae bacterium]|nr:MAG: hypothetical protein EOO80_01295 [Oxalobacteraceae bacterium]
MHATLELNCNLKFAALWCAILIACVSAGMSDGWPVVLISGLAGVVAGALQGRAIRLHPSKFLAAVSASEVRQALMQSRSGKFSFLLLWLVAMALLVLLVIGRPAITLQALLGAYASFALGRELLALRTVLWLAKSE